MKKTAKQPNTKPVKMAPNADEGYKHEEIKTDYPLSEKDEVKAAETRMRKARKGIL